MRRWGGGWTAMVFAGVAQGAIYEHGPRVDDEDDVLALEEREELSMDEADNLVELLNRGVELSSASRSELEELPGLDSEDVERILEYRRTQGHLDSPDELLAAGLVDGAQLRLFSPFLRSSRGPEGPAVRGDVRLLTQIMTADTIAPPVLLGGHVSGPFGLSGDVWLATTRQTPAPAAWDPAIDALVTKGFEYRVSLPAAAIEWRRDRARVVAGTFGLGFGERLVLDNSRRGSPDGIMLVDGFHRQGGSSSACRLSPAQTQACAAGGSASVTSDFSFRELFRGVAASLEDLVLPGGPARVSLHGFASYQTRSLYQYEVYDRRGCVDPHDNAEGSCAAPPVYLPDLSTRVVSTTLPALFDELALGGHLSLELAERWTLGVTGYGASPTFSATRLDFQEWSRWPGGGPFGALGLNGALRAGAVGLFVEAARSFDHSPGNQGGGWGVEQRSTWSAHRQQLELSLRYYDLHFLNPYARPISAPGEYDGQRARNEAGARLRYSCRLNGDWRLGGRVDLWLNPFEEPSRLPALVTNLQALARVDLTRWRAAAPSLWVEARRRNLGSTTRSPCASGSVEYTEGVPFTCSSDLYRATLRLELAPVERLRLAAQGSLSWVSDVGGLRNDVVAWAELDARPVEPLRLRVRARYLFQDLSNNQHLEQSVLGRGELAWSLTTMARLALRYELYVLLDQRRSTLTRWPNPEHRFALDAHFTF